MFIGAGTFFERLNGFRLLWMRGPFGTGKSLLSIAITADLLAKKQVDRFVANMPISGRSFPLPVPLRDASVILDEAWLYLRRWNESVEYVAFLRKYNLYLLMPSIFPINKNIQEVCVTLYRDANLYGLGIPAWYYKWYIGKGRERMEGRFLLWKPHKLFGMYDTKYLPMDDGGIAAAIRSTMGLDRMKSPVTSDDPSLAMADMVNSLPDFEGAYSGKRRR